MNLHDPVEFVRMVNAKLGRELYPWQERTLEQVGKKGSRVVQRTCNESGKTSVVIAGALLWNAILNPGSTGVMTSSVFRQVRHQAWPALRRMAKCFPNLGIEIIDGPPATLKVGATESSLVGFTASEGDAFEGFHVTGSHSSLLLVVDEAKSVDETIFQAVERCRPDRLLVMSSPGGASGPFYRAHTKERHVWTVMPAVTVDDCPHLPPEHKALQIAKWGENHPLVRSMLFADWMEQDGQNLVVPLVWVERCLASPPARDLGERAAGLDFAAGGDENVLCVRNGNQIEPMICWRERDTMSAVGRFIVELRRRGLKPEECYGDESGLGKPMCDALEEAGWRINRVNFGGSPVDGEEFQDRGTEMWNTTGRLIERCELALPKDDDRLVAQLTCRVQKVNSRGRLKLESKEDMRKRGVESPDRADGLVLACAGPRRHSGPETRYSVDVFDHLDEALSQMEQQVLDGVHTG
jgi:phage terminase large subunit